MPTAEKIKIMCIKKGNLTERDLAKLLDESPQNFNVKIRRDNFRESDLREIAEALGYELEIKFRDKATGEEI